MRVGVGSIVVGFLRKGTNRQQQALYSALACKNPTSGSRRHIGNIAGSKSSISLGIPGACLRLRFSTDRDRNGGKGTGDPPDDADTWDTTNEYEDGVSEDIPDYMHGSPTPRLVELFRGIRAADPDRVWDAFNDIANSGEWDQLAENEITQAIRVYNNQFSFERSSQALDRVKSIFSICSQRQFVFENTWSYNEMIRFHISEGRRDLAYKVKDRMESGQFGPNVVVDVHTYAPFFNDPYISSRKDIGQLVDLYDEMIFKRIKPDPRIEKALILHARKSGETQLLSKLLESTSTDGIPHRLGSLAARVISARTKAYTSMHKPRLAREELMKLLSYQIPKDTRPIPASYMKSSEPGQVNIPLSHSLTRDAFFIYLRSAYESLIRIRLVRRNPHVARELLDDMRRISYVPPSVAIYEQFIRYHAKRKDIHQLRGIYEMMQQDGVKVTEHFYTKFITSCMFKPKRRLLAFLTSKAIKISQEAADKLKGIENTCIDSTDGDSGADKAYIDNTDEDNGDDLEETDAQDGQNYSEVVLDAKAQEELSRLAFHPNECIRFFEDMLDDYGVDVSVIQDRGYIPNVQITNSVMRAYIQLERYKLALREFVRYCYHQNQLYPMSRPLDVERSPRTLGFVFKMALEVARLRKDVSQIQRIHTMIREWGVDLNSKVVRRNPK